jgi:hypothetical protein
MTITDILSNGIRIEPLKAEYAAQAESLQHVVFPDLAEEEILHENQYRKHLEIFPQGQFVAVDKNQVVGATTTMRYHYDLNDPVRHTFSEIMAGGWLTSHQPNGCMALM